jgi:hypothetical protein
VTCCGGVGGLGGAVVGGVGGLDGAAVSDGFLLSFLDADLADVQEVGVPDLLAQRSGELDGVDALAHDDHLVPVFAVELHGVDAARRRRQRHGLGPALVAAHAHPDHDLLLRVRIDDVCMC